MKLTPSNLLMLSLIYLGMAMATHSWSVFWLALSAICGAVVLAISHGEEDS